MKFAQLTAYVDGQRFTAREYLLTEFEEHSEYRAHIDRVLHERVARAIGERVVESQGASVKIMEI